MKSPFKISPRYNLSIPALLLFNTELKSFSKVLYALIALLSKKEGFCWASNKYISNIFSVSEKSISRAIKELKDKGFIRIKKCNSNKGFRQIYVIPIDMITNSSDINLNFPFTDINNDANVSSKNNKANDKESYPHFIHNSKNQVDKNVHANGQKCPTLGQNCPEIMDKNVHLINYKNKYINIKSKKDFHNWIANIESKGIQVFCDVNSFYDLMENNNWTINGQKDPHDWIKYFYELNNIAKNKYSKF